MRRLVLLVMLVGCVPLSYTYTPSTTQSAKSKPKNCKFDVLMSAPTEGYEDLGALELYNGKAPKSADKFKSAVADQVCDVGGDAVIATTDDKGGISKGTIIRLVHHAEPVKPITDMPATQQSDTELPKH